MNHYYWCVTNWHAECVLKASNLWLIFPWVSSYIWVCNYVCTYACMYVYVCMYVCVYVCIYVCVYECMYYNNFDSCSLKLKRDTWELQLKDFATTEILASNCILAAAFTVYCAPLRSYSRSVSQPIVCIFYIWSHSIKLASS